MIPVRIPLKHMTSELDVSKLRINKWSSPQTSVDSSGSETFRPSWTRPTPSASRPTRWRARQQHGGRTGKPGVEGLYRWDHVQLRLCKGLKTYSDQMQAENHCEQMGNFWKFFSTNSLSKVAQKYSWLLSYLEKINLCQNCCGYYWGNFWKHFGNFLNPAFGHTAESTHQRGKYHCTTDLLFAWFGFNKSKAAESKRNKQEVRYTAILPSKLVSLIQGTEDSAVDWINAELESFLFLCKKQPSTSRCSIKRS